MLNKCPYYAQILLSKWLMYYNLDLQWLIEDH